MRKVMLVIDDFSEMVGLESFLRRLGFDVLSLAKESLVNDALLSFQPEVVIASFRGRNVDGPRLAQKLKKAMIPPPRIALAYAGVMPTVPDDIKKSIEAMVEIPVEATSAINMLAKLSGLPLQPLLDKYAKVSGAVLTRDEQVVIITGKQQTKPEAPSFDPKTTPGQASTIRTERSGRYDRYLDAHADEQGFAARQSRQSDGEAQKRFRARESGS
jgi:hypothetical protein